MTKRYPKGVKVRDGKVEINVGWVVLRRKDVRIYAFDLRTKYAEVLCTSGQSHGPGDEIGTHVEVTLHATEHTLRADGPDGFTVVEIRVGAGSGWRVLTDLGRYTLTVVVFREPT